MNTRSELEEERRLFYVALTRAEKKAYLTYAQTRYRWGKLVDAEPSRFIEEIDDSFLDMQVPIDSYRYKPMIDADIFGDIDISKLRQTKPVSTAPPSSFRPKENQLRKLRKIKPDLSNPIGNGEDSIELIAGTVVKHSRFGSGKVTTIEGVGADKKATIDFEIGGLKKLILRFAKLEVVS